MYISTFKWCGAKNSIKNLANQICVVLHWLQQTVICCRYQVMMVLFSTTQEKYALSLSLFPSDFFLHYAFSHLHFNFLFCVSTINGFFSSPIPSNHII